MTAQREFILGEEKYVEFQVCSTIAQTIVITSATFVLSKAGETDVTGSCAIDGGKISTLIEPAEKGTYLLEITYIIVDEKRKVRVILLVV